MKLKVIVSLLLVFLFVTKLNSQKQLAPGIYMVTFTDKQFNSFSLTKASEFLSNRSLQRRQNQNIELLENDLPVSSYYIDSLKNAGFEIIHTSKWLNAVLIRVNDVQQLEILKNISFVKQSNTNIQLKSSETLHANKLERTDSSIINDAKTFYGPSFTQISVHNAIELHKQQFMGQGMLIAILDGGFNGAPGFISLTNLWTENRVILMRDIADPTGNTFFDDAHGANVLSIIAGYREGGLIGSAPRASFALIRTEYGPTEYPVEEFYWVVGAELADSIGADIINSSLGYSTFDQSQYNYTYADMNGSTAISTLGATAASEKGMVVVVSAGNEGNKSWYHITAPSDARNILCVGAISKDLALAPFSSRGPSSDGRVKPDVLAVGWGTVVETYNSITTGNGTSFSAPVISGLTACLWQACPHKTNLQIIEAIKASSSNFKTPNENSGYGIPDFYQALIALEPIYLPENNKVLVYPNPVEDKVTIKFFPTPLPKSLLTLTSPSGIILKQITLTTSTQSVNYYTTTLFSSLPRGIYILKITSGNMVLKKQIIKIVPHGKG